MAEIGSTLREARMRARIDISEVEVRTKIRAKYLRALENEEWDLLPGPVYVKSFLKTYGDFLGLDSRLLVDEYKRHYERPSDHEARAVASTPRDRDRRPSRASRVGGALLSPRSLIVVALAAIVVALYVIGSHNNKTTSGGSNGITPASTIGKTGGGSKGGGTGGGRDTTTTKTKTSTTPTTTTPATPKLATLAMVPTGSTWICVENQDGTPVFPAATFSTGDTIPTAKARALLVTLGNNEVTMTVDGKPYTPSGTSAIALKITPQGATPLTTAAPDCGE